MKTMSTFSISLFLLCITVGAVFAQPPTEPPGSPSWFRTTPPVPSGRNFFYAAGRGIDENEAVALRKAEEDAIERARGIRAGFHTGGGHISAVIQPNPVDLAVIRTTDGYTVYRLYKVRRFSDGAPNDYLGNDGEGEHYGIDRHPRFREYREQVNAWNEYFKRQLQETAKALQDRGVFYLDTPPSRNPIAAELANVLRSKITISEGTCRSGMRIQIQSPREPTCVRGTRIRGYSCRAEVSLVVTQCNTGAQNTIRGTLTATDPESENNARKEFMRNRNIANASFWDEWVRELLKRSEE